MTRAAPAVPNLPETTRAPHGDDHGGEHGIADQPEDAFGDQLGPLVRVHANSPGAAHRLLGGQHANETSGGDDQPGNRDRGLCGQRYRRNNAEPGEADRGRGRGQCLCPPGRGACRWAAVSVPISPVAR